MGCVIDAKQLLNVTRPLCHVQHSNTAYHQNQRVPVVDTYGYHKISGVSTEYIQLFEGPQDTF